MTNRKKEYAIGDVHGCFSALEKLIEFVDPSAEDLVVTLGDYVDRGPDSSKVLDWLVAESTERNLVCLRGNHEVMMMEARESLVQRRRWGKHGGAETWDSYFDDEDLDSGLDSVPDTHWTFMKNLLNYHETDTHIFVHAAAHGSLAMAEHPESILLWERFGAISPRPDGKVVVCGHTVQKSGVPKNAGHAVCIDTNACRGGWLTCLEVHSGEYFQANQNGETRAGKI